MKILVPVALIIVGAGLFGISQQYLSSNSDDNQQVNEAPTIKLVDTLIASQDITKGETLNRGHFEISSVPENEVAANTTLSIPPGAVALSDIAADSTLSADLIVTPDDSRYIEAMISDQMVPYPVIIGRESIVGGVISHGSIVDVIALSSQQQNLAIENEVDGFQTVSVSPILLAVKVLKVENLDSEEVGEEQLSGVIIVLELTRRQVATLSIAKNIAQLEIHKSIGVEHAEQLQANSGDVLPEYRAIVEYRGDSAKIR